MKLLHFDIKIQNGELNKFLKFLMKYISKSKTEPFQDMGPLLLAEFKFSEFLMRK